MYRRKWNIQTIWLFKGNIQKEKFQNLEEDPSKRNGDSCMGRVLYDNERVFPNEILRSLSQSQEARTESQRAMSQSKEPDRVYRA